MNGNDPTLSSSDPSLGPGSRVLIVAGIALLAGISVWFMTGCNRDGASTAPQAFSTDARMVPDDEITSIPDTVEHPVYWAGERPDSEVEMSDDPAGNVHLRYLTDGAEAGSSDQVFLDIGIYPFDGAYQATRALAGQANRMKIAVGDGIGFVDMNSPYSVILAFPDQPDLQVEVYHPEKNVALDVVRSGDIVPVP